MVRASSALLLSLVLVVGLTPARASESVPARAPDLQVFDESRAPEPARASIPASSPVEIVVTYRDGTRETVPSSRARLGADVARLRSKRSVLAAEPNRVFHATGIFPDDPNFSEQWALHNITQLGFGTYDADIDAPDAWDSTTGSSDVLVAIIDSGAELTHPDIAPRLWSNLGESGPLAANGLDDDLNGYADDFHGYDWVDGDGDPSDPNGHGTHVTAVAAGAGSNAHGISGVAWDARVMVLRVLDESGAGALDDIADAFDYAGDMGADIVNASLASYGGSEPAAIAAAIAEHPGTLYVVSAGNGDGDADPAGDNNDSLATWPCNLPAPNLICVTASDQDDKRPSFANIGSSTVDLAAPGVDILSASTTDPAATSGTRSLTDSPNGFYRNNADVWIKRKDALDLTTSSGCTATWNVLLETEYVAPADAADDWVYFEGRANSGPWLKLKGITGSSGGGFAAVSAPLGVPYEGSAFEYRFRLVSTSTVVYDGVYIDDFVITCDVNDPGLPVEDFESGLGAWTAGGVGQTWATTDVADQYEYRSGTSMAAPFVSGAAALVWSLRADGIDDAVWVGHVRNVLESGVDPARTWLEDKTAFGGRLNVARSVAYAGDLIAPDPVVLDDADVASRYQSGLRFRVTGSTTDAGGSGLGRFTHREQHASYADADFGAWRTWKKGPASARLRGSAGTTYCLRSRARDNALNEGTDGPERCTSVPVNDRTLDRVGAWQRISPGEAYRGTALRTSARGAKLTLSGVRAKHLALIATTCSGCGKIAIYHAGALLKKIDLNGQFRRNRVLNVASLGDVTGPGAIRIEVLTSGKQVVIEGLGIARV